MTAAVLAAVGALDLFGEDSAFVTVLLIVTVIGTILLWLVRKGIGHQGIKDFLGISSAFLALVFVAVLMMVVEHAGG